MELIHILISDKHYMVGRWLSQCTILQVIEYRLIVFRQNVLWYAVVRLSVPQQFMPLIENTFVTIRKTSIAAH